MKAWNCIAIDLEANCTYELGKVCSENPVYALEQMRAKLQAAGVYQNGLALEIVPLGRDPLVQENLKNRNQFLSQTKIAISKMPVFDPRYFNNIDQLDCQSPDYWEVKN